MKKFLLYVISGALIGGIVVGGVQRTWFWPEREPQIQYAGDIWHLYDWQSGDSLEVKIEETDETYEPPVEIPKPPGLAVKKYEFSIRHNQTWEVSGRVFCNQLERIAIDRIRFWGESRLEVLSDGEMRFTPATPNLRVDYLPDETIKKPRKSWLKIALIAGVQIREPYHPLLLGGISVLRLPLIGRMPDVMLGLGAVQHSPIIWIGKIWKI